MENLDLCIRIAANTDNPALLAIKAKNYEITKYYVVDEDGNETSEYEAVNNNRKFSAKSPLELLGLIGMWEVRGDDWKYNHETELNLYDELTELAITYDQNGNVVEY